MSCIVSRLLTDVTPARRRQLPVGAGEDRGSGAGCGRPRLVLLCVPPGLTTPSIAHARASAWYFALSYAYASAYAFAWVLSAPAGRSIPISQQPTAIKTAKPPLQRAP